MMLFRAPGKMIYSLHSNLSKMKRKIPPAHYQLLKPPDSPAGIICGFISFLICRWLEGFFFFFFFTTAWTVVSNLPPRQSFHFQMWLLLQLSVCQLLLIQVMQRLSQTFLRRASGLYTHVIPLSSIFRCKSSARTHVVWCTCHIWWTPSDTVLKPMALLHNTSFAHIQ